MDKVYSYLQQAVVTAIIVVAGLLLYKHDKQRIVKVDLVAITTHYTAIMAKDTMSSDTSNIKKISDTIKINLEPLLSSYAQKNNAIVLQSQAVVEGSVPDITPQIIDELDRKLK